MMGRSMVMWRSMVASMMRGSAMMRSSMSMASGSSGSSVWWWHYSDIFANFENRAVGSNSYRQLNPYCQGKSNQDLPHKDKYYLICVVLLANR